MLHSYTDKYRALSVNTLAELYPNNALSYFPSMLTAYVYFQSIAEFRDLFSQLG